MDNRSDDYDMVAMAEDAVDAIGSTFNAVIGDVYPIPDIDPGTVVFYVDTPGGRRFQFTVTEVTDLKR
jgi:hypothetical protein